MTAVRTEVWGVTRGNNYYYSEMFKLQFRILVILVLSGLSISRGIDTYYGQTE
jgi:hypothetical protein